jgi:glycosyltransferase involved in cell wall biosynthesis
MMENPFFSIIIPTFNRNKSIFECINSVIVQSFTDFEIIIVDNQSTDNTIDIVKLFTDTRIKFFVNDKNYERCYSRNKGIEKSSGKYITFLDSDDFIEQTHLQNWFEFISKNQDLNTFFISQKKINKEGNYVSENYNIDYSNQLNLFKFPVIPGQACIPKNLLKSYNFKTEYLIFEDTALWLQLSMEYAIVTADINSYTYNINSENSVNVRKNNFGKTRFNSINNFIVSNPTIIKKLGLTIFKNELANSLFQIAKFQMANQKRFFAIKYIIKSIRYRPSKFQLKHKLLIIMFLIINKQIDEYYFKVKE